MTPPPLHRLEARRAARRFRGLLGGLCGGLCHLLRGMLSTLLATAAAAQTLSPAEVFAKVSPSIWKVIALDADGLPLGQGSAVVVAEHTLVTNCHVLAKARRVLLKREAADSIEARLSAWDVQRDLCQLSAPTLNAPAVALSEASKLAVGQVAYAIGHPRSLDLTMSEGLVSSLRHNAAGQLLLVQTSAAISGGSSGGGLFDPQGALVGLTTLASLTGVAQNLNFAIPAEWIKDLPRRHANALATRAAAKAAAASAPASAAAR